MSILIRYYITDRLQIGGTRRLVDNVAAQLVAGIEMIQLRERDLSAADLFRLSLEIMRLPNPLGTRLLINDRADIAIASGASGVHLRGNSVSPSRIRAMAPSGFTIGVSCHTVEEVIRADGEGATFAVLGPIFESAGKGPAIGLRPLSEAARAVSIPVLALGGITRDRIGACMNAGADGIAGISLFQSERIEIG